jgi:hypothetical protein
MRTGNTRKHRAATDNGSALIMVLIGMVVLSMFATVALTYSTQTLKVTRHTQDFITSLAAAQAGVDEYLARLNKDDSYWQKNPAAVPVSTAPDCWDPIAKTGNIALVRPLPAGNPNPCGWGANTPIGWAPLAGSIAFYHYDVDATSTPVDGTIDLTVTGKANKTSRTIEVTLRRGGFGEFLYFTDYETTDPSNEAKYGYNNQTAISNCAHHFWDPDSPPSKPRVTSYCDDIVFTTGDALKGPTHSNDAIKMSGSPRFEGNVSTSWPNCRPGNDGVAQDATSCYRGPASPTFVGGSIIFKDLIAVPVSITSLRQYVDYNVPNAGCLYTGPTRIKILAPSPGTLVSRMQVWSPNSTAPTTNAAKCGGAAALGDKNNGATLPIPNDNIILIQNVPATQTLPLTGSCAAGAIGDSLPQDLDANRRLLEADCRGGNVYIQGQLTGKLTVSAENNIIITGDLTYHGGRQGGDVLGLIATNSVKVYHPVECNNYNNGKCGSIGGNMPGTLLSVNIDAAILTLQHSFTVQYYNEGAKQDKIHLFGSIAQKYRGPVGIVGTNGYLKDYVYDTRLRYAPPPYFLDPISSAWGLKSFGEVNATYPGS